MERPVTEQITWTNDTAALGDLVPWERNPKRISRTHAARLLEYWQRIGQFQTIAIGPSGEVYDGHQRLSVLLAANGKGYRVDVRRSSRPLTDKEREELVIAAHVGTTGSFDWDALAGWDADNLQQWGFDAETLDTWRGDASALAVMLDTTTWDDAFASLPDSDRAPFQQMTFTLHDEQAEVVKDALRLAQTMGDFEDTGNENSNGNALARICETFLTDHGQS